MDDEADGEFVLAVDGPLALLGTLRYPLRHRDGLVVHEAWHSSHTKYGSKQRMGFVLGIESLEALGYHSQVC